MSDYALEFLKSWMEEAKEATRDVFGIHLDEKEEGLYKYKEHPFLLIALYQAISIHKMEQKQNKQLEIMNNMLEEFKCIKTELEGIKEAIDSSATTISQAINNRYGSFWGS